MTVQQILLLALRAASLLFELHSVIMATALTVIEVTIVVMQTAHAWLLSSKANDSNGMLAATFPCHAVAALSQIIMRC